LEDVTFWEKLGLGLLAKDDSLPPPQREKRKAYTETQLSRAAAFLDLLHRQGVPPAGLKVLNVVGTGRATLARGAYSAKNNALYLRKKDMDAAGFKLEALEADGDGTVPTDFSTIPPSFSAATKTISTPYPHDKLFNSPQVQQEIFRFLRRGQKSK
jgi:hypothetical protein